MQVDECFDLIPEAFSVFDDVEDISMNLEPCGSLLTGESWHSHCTWSPIVRRNVQDLQQDFATAGTPLVPERVHTARFIQ